jgi:hypothetical protein
MILMKGNRLHTSGAHSDFTFTCGTDVHSVHKNIICARSGSFERAVRFEGTVRTASMLRLAVTWPLSTSLRYSESALRIFRSQFCAWILALVQSLTPLQEANTTNIDFLPEEDNPKLIKLIVQYMYEAEYDSGAKTPRTRSPSPRPLTDIYGRPYSYKFPHICQDDNEGLSYCPRPWLCPHHFCREGTCGQKCRGFVCQECTLVTEQHMALHAGMAMIASKYDVHGLQDLAKLNFMKDCEMHWDTPEFAEAAKYVCETPVEGLKETVVDTIVAHNELLKKVGIMEVLKKSDGLACEVLRKMAD